MEPTQMSIVTSTQLHTSSSAQPKQQVRHLSSHLSLAQQQQQQSQDIKPALLSQSHAYRQRYTYKDKFHALRERYDQVFTMNEALKKDLAVAQSKQVKLENNLLIDGIGIIAPYETAIEHYMHVQNAEEAAVAPFFLSVPTIPPENTHPAGSANGNTAHGNPTVSNPAAERSNSSDSLNRNLQISMSMLENL